MIGIALITILWGFGWHFSKALVDASTAKTSWNRIISYTVGICAMFVPFYVLTRQACRNARLGVEITAVVSIIISAAYWMAAVGMGIGTAIGWAVWDGER